MTRHATERILVQYHKTRIGELILGSIDEHLCLLDFRWRRMRATIDRRLQNLLKARYEEGDSDVLSQTRQQIEDYLDGRQQVFSVPLRTAGTPFQERVWQALREIPYGQTTSYGELARMIGNPAAVRAVAGANGANAIGLIIPCHRVIASDGSLGGYGGGVPVKKHLLKLEGALTQAGTG